MATPLRDLARDALARLAAANLDLDTELIPLYYTLLSEADVEMFAAIMEHCGIGALEVA